MMRNKSIYDFDFTANIILSIFSNIKLIFLQKRERWKKLQTPWSNSTSEMWRVLEKSAIILSDHFSGRHTLVQPKYVRYLQTCSLKRDIEDTLMFIWGLLGRPKVFRGGQFSSTSTPTSNGNPPYKGNDWKIIKTVFEARNFKAIYDWLREG